MYEVASLVVGILAAKFFFFGYIIVTLCLYLNIGSTIVEVNIVTIITWRR